MIPVKTYLREAMSDLSKDVDLIFDHSTIASFLKDFKDFKVPPELKSFYTGSKKGPLFKKDVLLLKLDSSKLKSKDAMKAHEIRPLLIYIGFFNGSSNYSPKNGFIKLTPSESAMRLVFMFEGLGLEEFKKKAPQFVKLLNEFNPERMKATISHELNHWVSDTLNNFHITKRSKTIPSGLENSTDYEIDSQIYGIAEIKRKHQANWDTMTLLEVFELYPTLSLVYTQMKKHSIKELKNWLRKLIKRMVRENLLGKKMRLNQLKTL